MSSERTLNAAGEIVLPATSVSDGEITGLLPWPSCESGLDAPASIPVEYFVDRLDDEL